MQTWRWLYKPGKPFDGRFIIRVLVKTALLFVALNAAFALLDPLPALAGCRCTTTSCRGAPACLMARTPPLPTT